MVGSPEDVFPYKSFYFSYFGNLLWGGGGWRAVSEEFRREEKRGDRFQRHPELGRSPDAA